MSEPTEDETYRGPTIPERVGEQLKVAVGLSERPRTFGDWVQSMETIAERDGIDIDLDALCTTDESPHCATFDGRTQHYRCTQDAFIVPFLAEDVEHVEIETKSPVSERTIQIMVTESGVEVEPPETVMSFGVAADVEDPPENAVSPILAYERVCPYGNAFTSPDEYETWAANVEAETMAVSVEDTLAFARAIGDVA